MSHVHQPAFAHKLPPRDLSLSDLAELAVLSSRALNGAHDMNWNAMNSRAFDDREAFRAQFYAVTGLSVETVAELLSEGIL